jgi:hypothetical protein
MRYTFISSAALVTTLLATSAYSSSALAQKAALLAPVTQWAVTKVDATAKQGGYCALARRFGQNTILTLARNGASETSLALDFQAPKLKAGDNIKIVLDPGAGEQRSYYVSPISPQAFVVRLGRDDRFFNALQETGFLRIDANGQSYSFNLADIDAGHDKLQGCVARVGGTTQEASSGMHNEIENLRRDVLNLKKENQRLAGVMQDLPPGEVAVPDEIISERLSGQARALETRNESLRYQHEQQTGVSAGQIGSDIEALGTLRSENVRLSKQLASLTLSVADNEIMAEQVSSQASRNRSLRQDVVQNSDGWHQGQIQISSLQEQNQRLQQQLQQASREIAIAQNDAQAATEEKEQLKNILEEVKDEATKEPPPMPEEENVIPPSDGEASAEPTPLPVEASSGKPSVDELMAQIRDKDAKLVELSNLQMEVEKLRKENSELQQRLMDGVKDKDTIAGLNEKIRTLEEENNRLIQQVQNNPSGTDTPKDEQISALTAENARLQKEIDTMKAKADEVEKLRSQLTALQSEYEALKNKPPEAAAATPEQTAQIEVLTKENAELKARVESLTAELKTAAETKLADGSAPVSNGATCTAEVNKAVKTAEEEKQVEMATLAKENMTLKQKLAQFMGGGKAAVSTAEAPADVTAQTPVEEIEIKPVVNPPEEISNIVAADYPPPASEAQTEAQRQEAEMMNSMKAPAKVTPPVKPADDIKWNQPFNPSNKGEQAPSMNNKMADVPAAMPPATDNSPFSVQDVLVSAQIAQPGQIQKIEKASGPDRNAYQWKAGAVYGSAEQKVMNDASQFETQVQQYLEKTKSRCAGDFAASPDNSWQNGPVRVDTYEIACIGRNISSTASLAFINKGGSFTVVAHEASADEMADAMSLRDRIVRSITGS